LGLDSGIELSEAQVLKSEEYSAGIV